MDIGHPQRTKMGITRGELNTRTGRQTANPGMMPLVHLPLDAYDARDVETHLQSEVYEGRRDRHMWTGSESEWFSCTPPELVRNIAYHYVKCYRDLYYLYNDDDGNRLHLIATFPPVDFYFVSTLGMRTSSEEFDRYIAAYNGVREALGLPAATEEELYTPPNQLLYGKPRTSRR